MNCILNATRPCLQYFNLFYRVQRLFPADSRRYARSMFIVRIDRPTWPNPSQSQLFCSTVKFMNCICDWFCQLYVALSDPDFMKFQQWLGPFLVHWRTTLHANEFLTIFQDCWYMCYSWKIVRNSFACVVVLQSTGKGHLSS